MYGSMRDLLDVVDRRLISGHFEHRLRRAVAELHHGVARIDIADAVNRERIVVDGRVKRPHRDAPNALFAFGHVLRRRRRWRSLHGRRRLQKIAVEFHAGRARGAHPEKYGPVGVNFIGWGVRRSVSSPPPPAPAARRRRVLSAYASEPK